MSSSMGRMTSHILWKIKDVPNHQPVNHLRQCLLMDPREPPKKHLTAISCRVTIRWGWVEIIKDFHMFNITLAIFGKWELDITIKDWDLDHFINQRLGYIEIYTMSSYFIHIWDINILRKKRSSPIKWGWSTTFLFGYLGYEGFDSSPNGNSPANIDRTIWIIMLTEPTNIGNLYETPHKGMKSGICQRIMGHELEPLANMDQWSCLAIPNKIER